MQARSLIIGAYIAAAAAGGLALGAGAVLAQGGAKPAVRETSHGHPGEAHPSLHRALRDLERARFSLEKAPENDNIDGRRDRALKLVRQAIDEINRALYRPQKSE